MTGWDVLHVAWHVAGSYALGVVTMRWWWARREARAAARDAAARLGAPRRRRRTWKLGSARDVKRLLDLRRSGDESLVAWLLLLAAALILALILWVDQWLDG